MITPSEYLTYQTNLWDLRTRGIYCFDYPVELEPPFIPFFWQLPSQLTIDDSKRPTLASKIIDRIKGKKPLIIGQEGEILDYSEFEPYPDNCNSDLTCLQLTLEQNRMFNVDSILGFLSMVLATNYSISFEVYRKGGAISFQFTCRREDVFIVESAINTHFPSVQIHTNQEGLELFVLGKNTYVAECFLSEESSRPIRIFEKGQIDPMISIFGILDAIKCEGSFGIQIVFKGNCNAWSNSIRRSVTLPDGTSFYRNEPLAPKMALEKTKGPLFSVGIRVFSQENSPNHLHHILSSLITVSDGPFNRLTVDDFDSDRFDNVMEDIYLRTSHRLGMILSLYELATFVHLPLPGIQFKSTERSTLVLPVPNIALQKDYILGENHYLKTTSYVTINIPDRLKHMHVLGATGTGKSSFLAHLIMEDQRLGYGSALFDPHGDLVDLCISNMSEEDFERVVLIDPSDDEFVISLNLLHANTEYEKEVLTSDIVSAFRRNSTSWGDQMNTVLSNAILALLENDKPASMQDIRRFLIESKYRGERLLTCSDPSLKYYWSHEYPLLKTNSIGPILTRLDSFLRPKTIRYMVSQADGIDFREIIDSGKTLFVKLPVGLIGRENSYLLGSLILSKLHLAALSRQSTFERKPYFVHLDEFHHFITPSVTEMLSGVRKYQMGLVLAHQDITQLEKDRDILEGVFSNCYTRICFRVGERDAKKLVPEFDRVETTDLQNLGRGQAIVKIEQPHYTTTMNANYVPEADRDLRIAKLDLVRTIARKRYAKPRAEVERIIAAFLNSNVEIEARRTVEEIQNTKHPERIHEEKEVQNRVEVPVIKESKDIDEKKAVSTHRYLQELIKRFAENHGFKVTLEAPIQGGQIDVLLERENLKIAVEVSITTDAVWEVHNIKKCVQAGFSKVISVSGDPKQLKQVEALWKEESMQADVEFLTPDKLFLEFQKYQIEDTNHENGKLEKGYRVKVSYKGQSETIAKYTKDSIAQILLKSINKNKKK